MGEFDFDVVSDISDAGPHRRPPLPALPRDKPAAPPAPPPDADRTPPR